MRRRLVRVIVAVTALALLLFGLPLAFAVQRVYHDEEVIRLQRVATDATQSVAEEAPGIDPVELPTVAGTQIALYGPAGRRLAGRGPALADAVVRRALAGRASDAAPDGRLVVAVPVARREAVVAVVRAERPESVVAHRVRRAWLLMCAIALGVLAVVAVIAAVLARRLVAPVDALASSARRLGDGDFASRAPSSGVPELDAAAGALNQTAQRLGDMVERERAFSSDASHQLRTPLTALRLDLERGQIDRALKQVDRLEETVATLLAAARDGGSPAEPAAVAPLLDELERTWRGPLAADGRPLRVVVEDGPLSVLSAPGAVQQILGVLLDNAHRHGAGTVTVRARRAGSAVAIDVSDEGPGLTGDPESVFARRSPAASGHGIGLSLARSLAVADGGRLVLTGTGPGPTFSLLLVSS